jgi:hypothetical protein
MPVNTTHSDYDFGLPGWLRARDVLAGELNVIRRLQSAPLTGREGNVYLHARASAKGVL